MQQRDRKCFGIFAGAYGPLKEKSSSTNLHLALNRSFLAISTTQTLSRRIDQNCFSFGLCREIIHQSLRVRCKKTLKRYTNITVTADYFPYSKQKQRELLDLCAGLPSKTHRAELSQTARADRRKFARLQDHKLIRILSHAGQTCFRHRKLKKGGLRW